MKRFFAAFLFLFLFAFSKEGHTSFRAKDSEFWLESSFWKEKEQTLKIYFLVQSRWKEQASLLYHKAIEGGLQSSLSNSWSSQISYRQVFTKNDDCWLLEANPRFSLTRKEKLNDWTYSMRHLVEYKGRSHKLVYRNRLQMETFPAIAPYFSAFVMNELFFEKEFTQNRFRIGIKSSSSSSLKTTLAYQFQLKKVDSSWYGINAAYLAFSLTF